MKLNILSNYVQIFYQTVHSEFTYTYFRQSISHPDCRQSLNISITANCESVRSVTSNGKGKHGERLHQSTETEVWHSIMAQFYG